MPKPNALTGQKAVLRADRAAEIMRLRRTTNMSVSAIAAQVGMDKSNAHRVILKSIKNVLDREAGELLVHELQRLQQIEDSTVESAFEWRVALDAEGKAIYEPLFDNAGRAVRDESGAQVVVPRRDYSGNERGKAILLKIADQRARLLGLYTTKIQDMTPSNDSEELTFRIVDAREGAPAQPTYDVQASNPHPMPPA